MQQGLPLHTRVIYYPFFVYMNASYNTSPFKKYGMSVLCFIKLVSCMFSCDSVLQLGLGRFNSPLIHNPVISMRFDL